MSKHGSTRFEKPSLGDFKEAADVAKARRKELARGKPRQPGLATAEPKLRPLLSA